jgi:hypothetical protein
MTPIEFAMSINLKNLTLLLVVGLFLQAFVFSNISVGADLMKFSPLYAPKVNEVAAQQMTTQLYKPR